MSFANMPWELKSQILSSYINYTDVAGPIMQVFLLENIAQQVAHIFFVPPI